MSASSPADTRAGRREARRRARHKRLIPWLVAAVFAVAGLLALMLALSPRADVPAAPMASPVAPDGAAAFSEGDALPDGGTGDFAEADGAQPEALADSDEGTHAAAAELSGPDKGASAQPEDPSEAQAGFADGAAATSAPDAAPAGVEPDAASKPGRLTISAAGDCTLGGDASQRTYAAFARAYKSGGADYFLKNVRDIFSADDLTIVNLEGPLTTATRFREKEFAFKGRAEYAKILTEGGVEVANVANNHAKDYYTKGLTDTANALKKAGVAPVGWGRTKVFEVGGAKVGFCGFAVWYVSKSQMKKQIAALKAKCDLVVASIHFGEEGVGRATKVQREYARAAVDAGAGLVLGHHPHVVGGIEVYRGATIVYSLANFCFGGNLNPDDKDTFIFQQTFELREGGPAPVETVVIPCTISGSKNKNDYQPALLTGDDAERVLGRIEKLSKGFETPVDLTASRARLAE